MIKWIGLERAVLRGQELFRCRSALMGKFNGAGPACLDFHAQERIMKITVNGRHMSQSRLDKIMTAETLDEAQRMSRSKRIRNLFRHRADMKAIEATYGKLRAPQISRQVKAIEAAYDKLRAPQISRQAKAIEAAYAKLTAPQISRQAGENGLSAHDAILEQYRFLWATVEPEHSNLCQMEVEPNWSDGTWSYKMHMDDVGLVACKGLPIGDGAVLTRFQDHCLIADAMGALAAAGHPDPKPIGEKAWADFQEVKESKSDALMDRHCEFSLMDRRCESLPKKLAVMARIIHAETQGSMRAKLSLSPELSDYGLPCVGLEVNDEWVFGIALLTDRQLKAAVHESLSVDIDYANQAWERSPSSVNEIARALLRDPVTKRPLAASELSAVLSDPLFCKKNLKSITNKWENGSSILTAHFSGSDGNQENGKSASVALIFPDGSSSERYRPLLLSSRYDSLSDLIENQQGTLSDPKIFAMTNVLQERGLEISKILSSQLDSRGAARMGLTHRSNVEDFMAWRVAELQDHPIGRTTYGRIGKALDWDHWSRVRENPPVNPDDASEDSDIGIGGLFGEHSFGGGKAASLSPAMRLDYV